MTDLIFDIPRIEVSMQSGGQTFGFKVRGLSDEDLLTLVRDHQESIKKMFARIEDLESQGATLENADISEFGRVMLEVVPELVAQTIALAADKPDKGSVSVMRQMPAPLKLRALQSIWQLTVVDTGGLGPFLDQVFGLLRGLRTSMDSTKAILQRTDGLAGGLSGEPA